MKKELVMTYLYKSAAKHNQPISVVIELLTRCNLRCEHCYLPQHNKVGMDFEKIKSVLQELRELGVVNLLFTGGEIFMRKDIFEIIEFATSLHFRVTLLTNATLLDEVSVQRLATTNVFEVSTTMFSTQAAVHDAITCHKGSLSKLRSNLELLRQTEIKVKVKMPIMTINYQSLPEMINYCKDNDFEFLSSPIIFPKNDGDESTYSLRLEGKKLIETMKILDSHNGFTKSEVHTADVPCTALLYSFSIDCEGNVFPCNSFYYKIGNVFDNSLKDIWYNSTEAKYIKGLKNTDLKDCGECALKSECQRCPGMALFDGDLLGCDKFSKDIALTRLCSYQSCTF